MSKLRPDMQVKRIEDIDLDYLWQLGIRGLVFDLDNTVTPWRLYQHNQDTADWFRNLRQRGFSACILSNNLHERVQQISEWLDIPVLGNSKKPLQAGFYLAKKTLGLEPSQLAMVGDQLLTDIYGGNRAGFFTILTEQLDEREGWGTRHISRRIEKLVRRIWYNKSQK
jgi:uncharacterized protein